jgi:hypothetical protein
MWPLQVVGFRFSLPNSWQLKTFDQLPNVWQSRMNFNCLMYRDQKWILKLTYEKRLKVLNRQLFDNWNCVMIEKHFNRHKVYNNRNYCFLVVYEPTYLMTKNIWLLSNNLDFLDVEQNPYLVSIRMGIENFWSPTIWWPKSIFSCECYLLSLVIEFSIIFNRHV